jgi:hypothetical protein
MKKMDEICCRHLSPAEWDQKEIVWRDKPFYKDHYLAFLHVPINFGGKIIKGLDKVNEAGLSSEQMVLTRNDTLWGADLLIPISRNAKRFKTEIISGKFFTKLFEGHYGDMGKWIGETKKWCKEKGANAQEFIFWYATCPKCAKKRGDKVQVVVFVKVE